MQANICLDLRSTADSAEAIGVEKSGFALIAEGTRMCPTLALERVMY